MTTQDTPTAPAATDAERDQTCGTCRHVRRCLAFGFTDSRERRECDWMPSRYALAREEQAHAD